jgi:very-short-patch-repair endonuclease
MEGKVRHAPAGGRERALAALANRQFGVVTRRQLIELGIGRGTIERWLSVGRLHRIDHGGYAVGHASVGRHARWLIAVLAVHQEATLSHVTAASLWGLSRARGPIDVTAPSGNQGRQRWPGIRLHRCRFHDRRERTARGGIPVTSVARTLFDLAEAVDFEQLGKAWEEADRLKLLRLGEIEHVCHRGRGRRSLRPIRRLLGEARAAETVRSPLEERFLAFCRACRIPFPATNTHVLDHEVDCLWPIAKLIAELDSWEYHGHRSAFERDRARDPKFLLAGYRTIRVTHRRLDREADQLAEEIRGLLRLGGA